MIILVSWGWTLEHICLQEICSAQLFTPQHAHHRCRHKKHCHPHPHHCQNDKSSQSFSDKKSIHLCMRELLENAFVTCRWVLILWVWREDMHKERRVQRLQNSSSNISLICAPHMVARHFHQKLDFCRHWLIFSSICILTLNNCHRSCHSWTWSVLWSDWISQVETS